MGLWALALFEGISRRKEMGVRKVLGASNSNLFYNFAKELIWLTIYSAIPGIPLAWFIMKQWISSYAFRTEMKWWFFVLPVLVLALISLLTIVYQTVQTTRTRTVNSLRYE